MTTNKATALNKSVVTANSIGKAFKIYDRKRDRIKQLAMGEKRKYFREYWALRDISFELNRGEALGIVGRNGSGKSTLLQLICGTLRPTEGTVEVNGKIAALLELGSGFNPDFTGRENVFLNGSLLGLTIEQIKEKMDDILSFADIGNFVDQPVRTYSSGMVVRLAFSVIANVDADILVIDEALAVGDAYFTQKCMRYIQRFREQGSLLFVSHDLNSVLSLCDQAILISRGCLLKSGKPKEVVEEYTKDLQRNHEGKESTLETSKSSKYSKDDTETSNSIIKSKKADTKDDSYLRWSDFRSNAINASEFANKIAICPFKPDSIQKETFGGDLATITSVYLKSIDASETGEMILGGEIVRLEIVFKANSAIKEFITGFILKNDKGLALLGDNTLNAMPAAESRTLRDGSHIKATFTFTLPLLPAGDYSISASVADGTQAEHEILHWINDALILRCQCTSICTGVAGVAMHSIDVSYL